MCRGDIYGRFLQKITSLNGVIALYLGALMALPSLYSQFGPLAGYTHRLGQFLDGLAQLKEASEQIGRSSHVIKHSEKVELVNVTVRTPGTCCGKQGISTLLRGFTCFP